MDKVKAMKNNYEKWKLDCLVILGGNGTHKTANVGAACNSGMKRKPSDCMAHDLYGKIITRNGNLTVL